ncbi:MAG: hypothetical protein AB8G95_02990 [Anaerolineae bacterium]
MDAQLVFICCCGGLLILLAVVGNGMYIRNVFRGRNAHVRLAEAGGYSLLHDSPKDVQKIFGGEVNGRSFVFRPAADTYRTYNHEGRSSIRVSMLMQIIFPLNNQALANISTIKKAKLRGVPDSFDGIWSVKPSADSLPADMQAKMYEFSATNAYPAGLHWPTYRSKPKVRKLTILERGKWENSFPAELYADAVSLLIYDHPNANIDLNEFDKLINQVANVAATLDP